MMMITMAKEYKQKNKEKQLCSSNNGGEIQWTRNETEAVEENRCVVKYILMKIARIITQ